MWRNAEEDTSSHFLFTKQNSRYFKWPVKLFTFQKNNKQTIIFFFYLKRCKKCRGILPPWTNYTPNVQLLMCSSFFDCSKQICQNRKWCWDLNLTFYSHETSTVFRYITSESIWGMKLYSVPSMCKLIKKH